MQTQLSTHVSATELVEGSPAMAVVLGKTLADKRISIVSSTGDMAVVMRAVAMKGSVGTTARTLAAGAAARMLAMRVLSGNYAAVAQALALELGESVSFGAPSEAPNGETPEQFRTRQRDDWDLWGKLTARTMSSMPQLTKAGKVAPKRARYMAAIQLYSEVRAAIDTILAEREAARKEREANEAPQS